MKNKTKLMQEPTTRAVLGAIFSISSTTLASLQLAQATPAPAEEFDIINLLQTGASNAVDNWLGQALATIGTPGMTDKMTAEQVEAIFEVFDEEIEEHLEGALLNTFRMIFPDSPSTQ